MRTDQKFDVSHLKFDKRLLDMHYKNKSLTPDAYKNHLQSLPDLSDNTAKVKLFEVEEKVAPTIDPSDPLASSLSATAPTDGTSGGGQQGDGGSGGHTPFGGGF